MSKRVAFGQKPRPVATDADAWVESRGKAEPVRESVPMKRLTIDIPADLHRRFKMDCADRGVKMADVLREMLERQYSGPS